jgi:hypothetical protein
LGVKKRLCYDFGVRLRPLLTGFACLAFSFLASPAAAQTCELIRWQETRSRAFTFIYPLDSTSSRQVAQQYADPLDAEYDRFAALFETEIQLPLAVRIYPSPADYSCLNPLAPPVPAGQFHSHVGGREIALIGETIDQRNEAWQLEALDSLRYELAVLFVIQVSAGKAPPGLEVGLGVYAQEPVTTFETRFAAHPPPAQVPSASWRTLWENPAPDQRPENILQAASITAYLVEVYGWSAFLDFLAALRTAENWRGALELAYAESPGVLEEHWRGEYYPLYFAGRWRSNALYNLSLAPYEQLIAAGAYQAAAEGLAQSIELLITLGDYENLSRAQELNIRAQNGLAADALARQSRQAYLSGDFQNALSYALQATQIYQDLGDTRNTAALAEYAERAREVLSLRGEIEQIQADLGGFSGPGHAGRLQEIGVRLDELGDPAGVSLVNALLALINNRQRSFSVYFAIAGGSLALLLLAHRIRLLHTRPPDEALLQWQESGR